MRIFKPSLLALFIGSNVLFAQPGRPGNQGHQQGGKPQQQGGQPHQQGGRPFRMGLPHVQRTQPQQQHQQPQQQQHSMGIGAIGGSGGIGGFSGIGGSGGIGGFGGIGSIGGIGGQGWFSQLNMSPLMSRGSSWLPSGILPPPQLPPPDVSPLAQVPNLNGTWFLSGDPGRPARIIQWRLDGRAVFINEKGSQAWGTIQGDTVWIPDWSDGFRPGLMGTLRGDRIIWPDGNFWSRTPAVPLFYPR